MNIPSTGGLGRIIAIVMFVLIGALVVLGVLPMDARTAFVAGMTALLCIALG